MCGVSQAIFNLLILTLLSRRGKSGDLGDPGSRKFLQILEDLNKVTNNFAIKAFKGSKSCPNK